MEAIRVVLDSDLLGALGRAAKRGKVSRSVLVRRALREHLRRLDIKELEARDRQGYQQFPEDPAEAERWARVAVWPEP
jgi:metal-responsive CopG/Arc/MetJ family transcriptional regulator